MGSSLENEDNDPLPSKLQEKDEIERSLEAISKCVELDGRITFLKESSEIFIYRSVKDWASELNLPNLTSPRAKYVEKWLDQCEDRLRGCNTTKECFLNVVLQDRKFSCIHHAIRHALADETVRTLQDVGRIIMQRYNKFSDAMDILLDVVELKPFGDVSEATAEVQRVLKAYAYCCLRKRQLSFFTEEDIKWILLRKVPAYVKWKIVSLPTFTTYSYLDLVLKCYDIEAEDRLKPLSSSLGHQLKTSAKFCFCCGENGHIKKDCQYLDSRCSLCGKKGHKDIICSSKPLPDKKQNEVSDQRTIIRLDELNSNNDL